MPNEIIEGTDNLTPTVTADIAKAKIRLSLTQSEMSLQALQDKADKLVFNEDNLEEINGVITAIKAANNKIEAAFKAGKKPHWDACEAWNAAKNDLTALTAPILTKVEGEHTKLCQAIEKRKREVTAENKRKADIEERINLTILGFSQEITACKTTADLVSIQNRINAEQGKKSAYQEFLPTLVERCAELNQPLKDQKEAIKKLEDLERDTQTAIETGNDELLQEVENKKEEITGKINENKVRVEESAINSSIRSSSGGGYYQTFPEVKTKRKVWKTALYDVKAAVKNDLSLLKVELNPEFVKVKLKTLQEAGILKEGVDGKEDVTINGIRYYLDKSYS